MRSEGDRGPIQTLKLNSGIQLNFACVLQWRLSCRPAHQKLELRSLIETFIIYYLRVKAQEVHKGPISAIFRASCQTLVDLLFAFY